MRISALELWTLMKKEGHVCLAIVCLHNDKIPDAAEIATLENFPEELFPRIHKCVQQEY